MRTILAIVLLLLFVGYSAAQSKGPEKEAEKRAKSDQKACAGENCPGLPSIVFNVSPTQTVNQKPAVEPKHEQRNPADAEWWTAYATIGLAFITATLAYFTLRLWISTSDLVEGADDTAKKELRAYLGVRAGNVLILDRDKGHLQANVEVHNTGRTPAHRVTKAIKAEIRDAKNPGTFEMPPDQSGKPPIVPGAYWTFRDDITKDVTKEVLKELEAYTKAVFVWGQARYFDEFGKGHTLAFRFRNLAARRPFIPQPDGSRYWLPIDGWDIEPEEDGNYSKDDEEAPRKRAWWKRLF